MDREINMRIYTKHINVPEKGDIVFHNEIAAKGKITAEEIAGDVYEVRWDNGDCEEYEFDILYWDSRNEWWEIY